MAEDHDSASGSLAPPSAIRPDLPPAAEAGDPLSDVLRSVKLTGALFFMVDAGWPWGLEVPEAAAFAPIILPRARHVVSYHVILEGGGVAWVAGEAPVRFAPGDVLVIPHADGYGMACRPGQPGSLTVEEEIGFFRDMAAGRLPFVIEEGGGGAERTRFVCGFLGCDARPFNPLLAALPRLLLLRRPRGGGEDTLDRLIRLTLDEARQDRPGSACLRLGLSELLFVEVARRYLETLPQDGRGWLAGLRDAGVGRALRTLHARPAEPWTLARLAREVGMSRTVLAARFSELIGLPPMQYLARWRIQLAARRLADGASKVAEVGGAVGYGSEAAFSRAFKKIAGMPPAAWRDRGAG